MPLFQMALDLCLPLTPPDHFVCHCLPLCLHHLNRVHSLPPSPSPTLPLQKTGLDVIPVFLVNSEDFQAVQPSLGSASEDAGQLLGHLLVIPGRNVGGNLNSLHESVSNHGVLAFIGVDQGQIGGPLEVVIRPVGILEVERLLLSGQLEIAALLLLLLCK